MVCLLFFITTDFSGWAQVAKPVEAQSLPVTFLKTSGQVIRDRAGKGQVLNLRGTNLGSWLSMEAWIGPLGKAITERRNWKVDVTNSGSRQRDIALVDGDLRSTGTVLKEAEIIEIDLGMPTVFDELVISSATADHSSDRLLVSEDKLKWDTVKKSEYLNGQTKFVLDAKARRYIVLKNKEEGQKIGAIAELYTYMDDDFSVRNSMISRFGARKTDELFDVYQQLWITTADLDNIRQMGMNMVRVPVYWMELMDNAGAIKKGAFRQMDWVISECRKRGMYVIIDLHGAPGGLDGYITSGQAFTNEIWNDPKWRSWTEKIWVAIAKRYKGNPTVAAYDLMNEPVSNNKAYPTKKLYDQLYHAVRAVDADHIIAMGAFYNFDFLGSPAANKWENVLYQAHYYNTDIDNKDSQEGFMKFALQDMASHQKDWNVPVYAGEYNFWQYLDIWKQWMQGLNAINASWSNWTYKNRVSQPASWGFYQVNENAVPDMSFDSAAEIKGKWLKFTTPNFKVNAELINTVKEMTPEPAVLVTITP